MTYFLNDPGADSLAVMATLRSVFRVSLGEARSIIAGVPAELPVPAGGDIEAAVERLRQAGAIVTTSASAALAEPEPEPESVAPASPDFSSLWGGDLAPEDPQPVPEASMPEPAGGNLAPEDPQPTPEVSMPEPADGDGLYDVMLPAANGEVLQLVKAIKEATGWGLKESKEWADRGTGSRAVMPAAMARRVRDYLNRAGFSTIICPHHNNNIFISQTEAPSDPVVVKKITITDPGPKRMQLIPLFKKELGMKYSAAANLAECGGEITSFPDQAAAARIVAALRSLGTIFTTE